MNIIYYCQSLIALVATQILHMIPLGLLLIILIAAATKLFLYYFQSLSLRKRIRKLTISENKKEKTITLGSKEKFAFVLGIRNPKIYISTGLVSTLSNKEFEAVLAHEYYHLENRDTFTMLIASIVNSISFIFPVLSDFVRNYRVGREIAADRFAVSKMGENLSLMSALQKILAAPSFSTPYAASIIEHDTLEERILSLLARDRKGKQFKLLNLLITFLSLLFIAVIIAMPVYASNISSESSSLCADKSIGKPYSEAPPAYTPIK